MKTHLFVLAALSSLAVAGCSSSPKIASNADPSVDFSQIRTYGFIEAPDTDGERYQSLETGFLVAAVSREMSARGLELSGNPDVLVNFSIETQEKIRSRSTPNVGYGVGYDPYYDAYYDGWGATHTTRIDQYTEGKLNIDLIDPRARRLIWQGSTQGRLTQKDMENAELTLNTAVSEVFQQFPIGLPQ
jgi:hypothetical protein